MISFHSQFHRSYPRLRAAIVGLPVMAGVMILSNSVFAIGVPQNLGNGLDRLLQSQVQIKEAARTKAKIETFAAEDGRSYTTSESAALANLAVKDSEGRLLVRIYGDGSKAINKTRKELKAIGSFSATATDKTYKGTGVMNAYVSLEDVAVLATSPGVRSVVLELKPRHNGIAKPASLQAQAGSPNATVGEVITQLGTYTDQGVFQHRVDQINKFYNPAAPVTTSIDGTNMQIACISNSFAANTANPASLDVTNNDLPGNASNPVGNTTPVFVLQDDLSSATSDDEGRGMCQIVYKMAPKAKVGFATANGGEVGFANNIRGLAGLAGYTVAGQTFAADVICDDVGYLDEPFYQDGIIGAGVDDVAAAGVSYFSSAANDIGVNGYESVIRLIPPGTGLTAAAGNASLAGTNINLANVPTNLYAGGFHNFNPNGLDVAQTVNVASNNSVPTILQWNDPYDQSGGVTLGAQIYASSGASTSAATPTTTTFNGSSTPPLPLFTAGQGYQIKETATSGTFDGIVSVIDPTGATLLTQDTGADETVNFTAPTSGQYQIRVTPFGTATGGVTTYTTGTYSLTVNLATVPQFVTSDWNLLAFNATTGAYIAASSLTTNNITTNQPIEFGFVNRTGLGQTTVQYVLARSNTPTGRAADHIRYLLPGNGLSGYGPAEYFTYNTVTTSGHATAVGCNGTAAYPFYRPNIPESFTSPGPATIYFDKNDNLLATPEVRLQPRVAAMDGGNISANEGLAGLGSDATQDYDAAANFFGTSAAAPHAAACALLTLQAHGGRRSLTPAQMTSILQSTAFPHDLDPNFSSGSAKASGKKITLTISSDLSSNGGTGGNDANAFSVTYTGAGYLTSLVFNPQATDATAGNTTGGNNGLDLTNTYFSNVIPGVVFPAATTSFALGSQTVGLVAADVTVATSNLATVPATTQNYTLTLSFPTANFTGGKILHFKINRGLHSSAVVPTGTANTTTYTADIFGGSVLLPDGTGTGTGMTFRATTNDGTVLNGTINNIIGAGYSKLDGFGFINAQAAALATAP